MLNLTLNELISFVKGRNVDGYKSVSIKELKKLLSKKAYKTQTHAYNQYR